MTEKLISHCGLDCSECDAYLATINDDQELRIQTAQRWSALNNTLILPENINCQGCRAGGIKTVFCEEICQIRKCAIQREIQFCGNCSDLDSCSFMKIMLKNNPFILESITE